MFNNVFSTIYLCVRRFLKWFLRMTTGLCELQRICYGEIRGAARTQKVDRSLQLTKNIRIKAALGQLDFLCSSIQIYTSQGNAAILSTVSTVVKEKKILMPNHAEFIDDLRECLMKIWGYKQLALEIEQLKSLPFSVNNAEHERKLLQLWDNLMYETPLDNRISKQWQLLGFQGEDPSTDFRGMGLLGLENLLYFSENHLKLAKQILTHSWHAQSGYGFAIVGINLTCLAYCLVIEGTAKNHFYNYESMLSLEAFHKLYCVIFFEFDKYWQKCKPKSIMDFPDIRKNFEHQLRTCLADETVLLKLNEPIETI